MAQRSIASEAGAPLVGITERQRLTLLITTVVGHGLKHMLGSAFFVLLPELKTGLGLSNTQVGALSTFRFIAGGIANFPAGFVADRFTRWRAEILGLSLAGIGVTALVLGMTTSYWVAVLAASLMVVSISFWHPAAIGALSRQFARRRGTAIALHGTGGSVGEATGPLLAGFLLGFLAWQTVFRSALIPAIGSGVLVWLALRTVPTDAAGAASVRGYAAGLRRVLADKRLLLILLFTGGFGGAQSVALTFLPIYLREDFGLSPGQVGLYLALAQVAGIGSQPLMGYVSDRWGRKAVIVPAMTVLGLAYLALSVAPPGLAFVAVVLVMGMFLYSMMAIFVAAAMDLVPGEVQATTVSLVFGFSTVVAGVAPYFAGRLADATEVTSTFVLAGVLALAAALLAAVTRWHGVRAE
jgi:MFS family permease